MPSDVVISVKNLSKTYRIFGHPGDRIKQALMFGQKHYYKEFTALKDVTFEIKKGETVGIIGHNGSGKSTLLQLICGILKPTRGDVQVQGRISALLELGAGFNPEFTGQENVYFQGAVLGLSRERMESKFDRIAALADIGTFMYEPVRTYSSGMFVRLAFATGINADADIFLVDEALSVGDAAFQRKASHSMQQFINAGGTLIYVSHDLESVRRTCSKAVLLKQGQLIAAGPTKGVCDAYEQFYLQISDAALVSQQRMVDIERTVTSELDYGNGEATIARCWFENGEGQPTSAVRCGEAFSWNLLVYVHSAMDAPIFGMMLKSIEGWNIYVIERPYSCTAATRLQAGDIIQVRFKLINNLMPGKYYMDCGTRAAGNDMNFYHRRIDSALLSVYGNSNDVGTGIAYLAGQVEFQRHRLPLPDEKI
jgi:ABC-type polysaccharide/polyol phosphate transport system ATPase subunit